MAGVREWLGYIYALHRKGVRARVHPSAGKELIDVETKSKNLNRETPCAIPLYRVLLTLVAVAMVLHLHASFFSLLSIYLVVIGASCSCALNAATALHTMQSAMTEKTALVRLHERVLLVKFNHGTNGIEKDLTSAIQDSFSDIPLWEKRICSSGYAPVILRQLYLT